MGNGQRAFQAQREAAIRKQEEQALANAMEWISRAQDCIIVRDCAGAVALLKQALIELGCIG